MLVHPIAPERALSTAMTTLRRGNVRERKLVRGRVQGGWVQGAGIMCDHVC
jgi:hypothetical protein